MSKYELNLDFIGKDSVRFKDTVEIPEIVYQALKELQTENPEDKLFSVNSSEINQFLKGIMPEASAKLFRTAYGTKLIAEELQRRPIQDKMTVAEKKAIYDNACLVVAKKLNHQRNVSKNFDSQMEKIDSNIQAAKEKLKETINKSKEQIVKIKENIEKIKSSNKEDEIKKEKISKLKEQKVKVELRIKKAKERLQKLEIAKKFKKSSVNYAIGTSRTAYSSPLLAFSWCKSAGIDISFIYSKTLREKFSWAANIDENYWKNYPNV